VSAQEYNFDGLIGPTHNFSGLALGNIASAKSRFSISHPKQAALQGLAKMKLLMNLGVKQGFIPPHERPNLTALKKDLGLKGSDRQILEKVSREDPDLLLKYSSASAMWVANAATVSPASDTADRKVHITPANLINQKHRSIETSQTAAFLKHIFRDKKFFVHHAPLKDQGDEGAANHMRLTDAHGNSGVEVFVYGQKARISLKPKKYPARQSYEASSAIAKSHRLNPKQTIFLQQNPSAIDAGVFHNDVIAVSNENVLLFHEKAYTKTELPKTLAGKFYCLKISSRQLTLKEAVDSYFFNSQIVTLPSGKMAFILPGECQSKKIERLVKEIIFSNNPLSQSHFVDLNESMKNGGGPACLRLRVVLSDEGVAGVHPGFILDDTRITILEKWINKNYRDTLDIRDLADYELFRESQAALAELTRLLNLGPIYSFQK
jgi:succinylarginine dihydrolase